MTLSIPTILMKRLADRILGKLIFSQSLLPFWSRERASLVVSWEYLAWERILVNVDSERAIARAGAVVGRDGSNQRNTKNRMRLLHFRGISHCGVPPSVLEKVLREPRSTRILW